MIAQLAPGVAAAQDKVKLVAVTPEAFKPVGTLGTLEHTAGAELLASDDTADDATDEMLDADDLLDAMEDALETEDTDDITELATELDDLNDDDACDDDNADDHAADDEETTPPRVP